MIETLDCHGLEILILNLNFAQYLDLLLGGSVDFVFWWYFLVFVLSPCLSVLFCCNQLSVPSLFPSCVSSALAPIW